MTGSMSDHLCVLVTLDYMQLLMTEENPCDYLAETLNKT